MVEFVTAWLFTSFIVERLTELLTKLIPSLKQLSLKQVNVEMFISLAFSVVIAFGADLNLFTLFGIEFKWPTVGVLLTGILTSGGSNVVHDIVSWIQAGKEMTKASTKQ